MEDEPKKQSPAQSTENTETSGTEKKGSRLRVKTVRDNNFFFSYPKSPESFKTFGDLYPRGYYPMPSGLAPVSSLAWLSVNPNTSFPVILDKEAYDQLREFSSTLTTLQDRLATQTSELQAI
jgi:hypothetical protein